MGVRSCVVVAEDDSWRAIGENRKVYFAVVMPF